MKRKPIVYNNLAVAAGQVTKPQTSQTQAWDAHGYGPSMRRPTWAQDLVAKARAALEAIPNAIYVIGNPAGLGPNQKFSGAQSKEAMIPEYFTGFRDIVIPGFKALAAEFPLAGFGTYLGTEHNNPATLMCSQPPTKFTFDLSTDEAQNEHRRCVGMWMEAPFSICILDAGTKPDRYAFTKAAREFYSKADALPGGNQIEIVTESLGAADPADPRYYNDSTPRFFLTDYVMENKDGKVIWANHTYQAGEQPKWWYARNYSSAAGSIPTDGQALVDLYRQKLDQGFLIALKQLDNIDEYLIAAHDHPLVAKD